MYATWLWFPVSNLPSVLWGKYSHSYFIEGLTLGRGATASHIFVTFEVIGRDETLLGGTGRASRMDHGAYQWWGEGEGVIREGGETRITEGGTGCFGRGGRLGRTPTAGQERGTLGDAGWEFRLGDRGGLTSSPTEVGVALWMSAMSFQVNWCFNTSWVFLCGTDPGPPGPSFFSCLPYGCHVEPKGRVRTLGAKGVGLGRGSHWGRPCHGLQPGILGPSCTISSNPHSNLVEHSSGSWGSENRMAFPWSPSSSVVELMNLSFPDCHHPRLSSTLSH